MRSPRAPFLAGLLIVAAALAAYGGTWTAPFVFDAAPIVTRYPTIRHLWPLGAALAPPHDGSTIEGRPLLNLSLALSYAWSGTRPWAYHVMNLGIHVLAGLALFGLARRLLRGREPVEAPRETRALGLAGVLALLWTLHPLQTESVTYIIQRAESQMGCLYLLTLYAFVRGAAAGASRRAARAWLACSWAACLAGMASKEVMVSAPVLVLLCDRAFVAGSGREAWRRRGSYYLALAATWGLLAFLVAGTGSRAGTAGAVGALSWRQYALTQIYAVGHYLRLAAWPRFLVFDYGTVVATGWAALAGPALVLLALAALTLWGLWRNRAAGFLGAAFFAILAPTSLVPISTQTMAEHRMYLPLAAVLAALLLGLAALAGRVLRSGRKGLAVALALGLLASAAGGALTRRRNALYGSEVALWADSVLHWPNNARAHLQLGDGLYRAGRVAEAAREFELSLLIQPQDNPTAHYDLGNCLLDEGRPAAAALQLAEAVRLEPAQAAARNNLGNAFLALGRPGEALAQYRAALALEPANGKAHFNLGNALAQQGDLPAAFAEYERSLQFEPDNPVAHFNLGNARAAAGDMPGAVAHYAAALRLRPAYPAAQDNWGNALFQEGRWAEALEHYRAASWLEPANAEMHYNLANALYRLGRSGEAADEYAAAVRLQPDFRAARAMLEHLRPGAAPSGR